MTFAPSVGDVYISDKGIGRQLARVVAVSGAAVVFKLRYTRYGGPRRIAGVFVLPASFLANRACGWVKSRAPVEAPQ